MKKLSTPVFVLMSLLLVNADSSATWIWDFGEAPKVGEIDPQSPGLEIVTMLPGEGWILWSETGEPLWFAEPNENEDRMPLFGVTLWDTLGEGTDEILVLSESPGGLVSAHVIDGDGTMMDPSGYPSPPTGAALASVWGTPQVADIDGDGDVDFVVSKNSGFVELYDDFAMTSLMDSIDPIDLPTRTHVTTADLTDAPGDEIVVSGDGAVVLLEYEMNDFVEISLPEQTGFELADVGATAATWNGDATTDPSVAIADSNGRVYRWSNAGSGFALDPGFPVELGETTRGPGAIGVWDGDACFCVPIDGAKIVIVASDGSLKDDSGADFPYGRARLPVFLEADRMRVSVLPATMTAIDRSADLVSLAQHHYVSSPHGPVEASSVPVSTGLRVWINDELVGEQFVSGDFVPADTEISVEGAPLSQTSASWALERVGDYAIVPPSATSPSASQTTLRYDLAPGEYVFRLNQGDAEDEVTLTVTDDLRLVDLLAYPSPATTDVDFTFGCSVSGLATVSVYTVSGKLVSRIRDWPVSPGYNRIPWNLTADRGGRVANGTYLFTIRISDGEASRKEIGRFSVAR